MKRRHKRAGSFSIASSMAGLLGVLAAFGVFMLYREVPAMRRYLRMERM